MIDSIYTAMSGLQGHQRALSTISHNVANMNTPGFRGSHVDFTDLINSGNESGRQGSGNGTGGRGVDTSHVSLDMRSGEIKQTERDLDLALDGAGFFVLRDGAGALRYTRNGQFEFDDNGVLVGKGHGMQVMATGTTEGQLAPVMLDGLRTSAPVGTTEVVLSGNLSSTDDTHTIESLVVYDQLGGTHTLKMVLTNSAQPAGTWKFVVSEGTRDLGNGEFKMVGGVPLPPTDITLTIAWSGAEPSDIVFKLGPDTTGFSSGTSSTLAMKSQDGRTSGQIASITFDAMGVLKLTYSNGQAVDGARLALAEVPDESGLVAEGAAVFAYEGGRPPSLRVAGDGLRIAVKSLELSNVDLTSEFSALILMQRGYQASSQVASTANDMLQQLFEMKGRR